MTMQLLITNTLTMTMTMDRIMLGMTLGIGTTRHRKRDVVTTPWSRRKDLPWREVVVDTFDHETNNNILHLVLRMLEKKKKYGILIPP